MADGLETFDYEGPNYKALVRSDGWRVAVLNHGDTFAPENLRYLERHLETDEVFVLLEGSAVLLIGEGCEQVPLARGKVYNVKRGVWHQIQTTPGTRCLVVENADTSRANSEYMAPRRPKREPDMIVDVIQHGLEVRSQ